MKIFQIAVALLFCFLGNLTAQDIDRIVSLVPSLTKNLHYLNVDNKLVGCTSYCDVEGNDKLEIVASAIKVNIEKVVSLSPDLVLATGITEPEVIEMLRKLGIRVEVFLAPTSFEEMCSQFITLGEIVDRKDTAKQIIEQSKAKTDSIKLLAQNTETLRKVFFQIGAKPLYTVFPNTYMDDYIRFLGAQNIAHDFNHGAISRESVLVRNPDVILIVTMGVAGEEEKAIWEKYPDLSATKNKQIHIIDADLACTPTPITFVQTLEILTKLLNL